MTGALFGLAYFFPLCRLTKNLQDKLITQLDFFVAITKWNTT